MIDIILGIIVFVVTLIIEIQFTENFKAYTKLEKVMISILIIIFYLFALYLVANPIINFFTVK